MSAAPRAPGRTPYPPLARVRDPIGHRTLRDHAHARVREALLDGRFAPGQHLTLRGLAATLGVSPTPVREAVSRLVAEGALESVPNSHLRVPPLHADTLRELREMRTRLEGLAAGQAARRRTEDDLRVLRAAEDAIVALRPHSGGDARAMIPAIRRFHFTVCAAARMPTLARVVEGLWLRTAPAVTLSFPGYTAAERGRHRARTLAAIEAGDADAACASMEADIGGTLDYLIALAEAPPLGSAGASA